MKGSVSITKYFYLVNIIMLTLASLFFNSTIYRTCVFDNCSEVRTILGIIPIPYNTMIYMIFQAILSIAYFVLMVLFLVKIIKVRTKFLFYLFVISGLLGFVFYPISLNIYLIVDHGFNSYTYSHLVYLFILMEFLAMGLVLYYFIQHYKFTKIQYEILAIIAFILKITQLSIRIIMKTLISRIWHHMIYYQYTNLVCSIIEIAASALFVIYLYKTMRRLEEESRSYSMS